MENIVENSLLFSAFICGGVLFSIFWALVLLGNAGYYKKKLKERTEKHLSDIEKLSSSATVEKFELTQQIQSLKNSLRRESFRAGWYSKAFLQTVGDKAHYQTDVELEQAYRNNNIK